MGYTSGTLIEGFSRAGEIPVSEVGAFIFQVMPGQGIDRLDRLGTLLQVNVDADPDLPQVSRVFKLFGSGVIAGADPSLVDWFGPMEIWVRLFVPRLDYDLSTK